MTDSLQLLAQSRLDPLAPYTKGAELGARLAAITTQAQQGFFTNMLNLMRRNDAVNQDEIQAQQRENLSAQQAQESAAQLDLRKQEFEERKRMNAANLKLRQDKLAQPGTKTGEINPEIAAALAGEDPATTALTDQPAAASSSPAAATPATPATPTAPTAPTTAVDRLQLVAKQRNLMRAVATERDADKKADLDAQLATINRQLGLVDDKQAAPNTGALPLPPTPAPASGALLPPAGSTPAPQSDDLKQKLVTVARLQKQLDMFKGFTAASKEKYAPFATKGEEKLSQLLQDPQVLEAMGAKIPPGAIETSRKIKAPNGTTSTVYFPDALAAKKKAELKAVGIDPNKLTGVDLKSFSVAHELMTTLLEDEGRDIIDAKKKAALRQTVQNIAVPLVKAHPALETIFADFLPKSEPDSTTPPPDATNPAPAAEPPSAPTSPGRPTWLDFYGKKQ